MSLVVKVDKTRSLVIRRAGGGASQKLKIMADITQTAIGNSRLLSLYAHHHLPPEYAEYIAIEEEEGKYSIYDFSGDETRIYPVPPDFNQKPGHIKILRVTDQALFASFRKRENCRTPACDLKKMLVLYGESK